jgi:hypothetical protein
MVLSDFRGSQFLFFGGFQYSKNRNVVIGDVYNRGCPFFFNFKCNGREIREEAIEIYRVVPGITERDIRKGKSMIQSKTLILFQ